jgi:hypothetical protein
MYNKIVNYTKTMEIIKNVLKPSLVQRHQSYAMEIKHGQ